MIEAHARQFLGLWLFFFKNYTSHSTFFACGVSTFHFGTYVCVNVKERLGSCVLVSVPLLNRLSDLDTSANLSMPQFYHLQNVLISVLFFGEGGSERNLIWYLYLYKSRGWNWGGKNRKKPPEVLKDRRKSWNHWTRSLSGSLPASVLKYQTKSEQKTEWTTS